MLAGRVLLSANAFQFWTCPPAVARSTTLDFIYLSVLPPYQDHKQNGTIITTFASHDLLPGVLIFWSGLGTAERECLFCLIYREASGLSKVSKYNGLKGSKYDAVNTFSRTPLSVPWQKTHRTMVMRKPRLTSCHVLNRDGSKPCTPEPQNSW